MEAFEEAWKLDARIFSKLLINCSSNDSNRVSPQRPARDHVIRQLGDHLIASEMGVFDKTLGELMPKRVICVWKLSSFSCSPDVSPLWSSRFLTDDWTDTDLPATKFESNMEYLAAQMAVECRVEKTVTPRAGSLVWCVKPVKDRIRGYARLFISQAFR